MLASRRCPCGPTLSVDRGATRVSYRIRQSFRYAYPGPIAHLRHRLIVAPPLTYGDQHCLSHTLDVTPDADVRWSEDAFGNRIATVEAARVDSAVAFAYEALVERVAGRASNVGLATLGDARYREPSALTFPSSALRDAAARLSASGDRGLALADRINAFVADHMRYVPGATSILTTAPEAFAQAAGVCQDYAHVMLALARACGFAARYVSGHLIGEGGTHAWVEIFDAGGDPASGVVWAFDPTHRRRTTMEYIFVASGSDYIDVAPTSGTFVAPYIGEFTSDRSVERVPLDDAAPDVKKPTYVGFSWGDRRGSNPRPPESQSSALTN